ncbi:CaiB/BaiF CoA transferase family protein [Halomarina pelagica]|uniref:CaiB/BaiF CoA transferase family protein n=1 Tax=Halomarina pelagica TaxID=2961599 RepID=UPI0020C3B356|nr:CoA transferase [Halomarina sp. BND7]
MTEHSHEPLAGVRVVDCTQMLSGPFASQLLADLGADVIKVERPGTGDITRAIEPTVGDSDVTGYFAALNRGKRSVELDLGSDEGAAALAALAASADVLVENFRPGTMEEWGLGSETLRAANPELVYCSISGFLPGPYRDRPAFDMVVQALGGSMSVTGDADGPPARPGIPIGDICAGMYAVVAVVTALYARDERGGQHVEVPMFEGLVSWLTERAGRTFATGEPYPRMGTAHPSLAPYRVFPAAEGSIALAVGSEGTWRACCAAVDRPDLAADPRFETNADRVEHREELAAELAPALAERTAEEWFETFGEHGVPAAPVKDTVEVFEDPHLRSSGTLSDLEIGGVDLPFVEFPVTFSASETGGARAPPALGEHTREVLAEVLPDGSGEPSDAEGNR